MKRATPNFSPAEEDKFEKGIGRWITVNSSDDLFRIGINIDFYKLGYIPLLCNDDSYDEA